MAKITDSQLQAVLAAVEDDLNKAFESEKEKLVKAAPPAPEESPGESATPETPPGSADMSSGAVQAPPPAPEGSEGLPPDMGDASAPPMSPGPEGSEPPVASPEASNPAEQEALDPAALQVEYAQLSPEELDIHLKAAMAAKAALAGPAGPGSPDMSAPPTSPALEAPPMGKGELPQTNEKANGGLVKSKPNPEVETLKALVKSQQEDIQNLAKVFNAAMTRPERKSIVSLGQIEYVKKSEMETPKAPVGPITPAEVTRRLNAAIPTLSKSERDTVLDFYKGKVSATAVLPILEKTK